MSGRSDGSKADCQVKGAMSDNRWICPSVGLAADQAVCQRARQNLDLQEVKVFILISCVRLIGVLLLLLQERRTRRVGRLRLLIGRRRRTHCR